MFNLVKRGFKGHRSPRVHKQYRGSDGVLQVLTEPQVVHERLRFKRKQETLVKTTGAALHNLRLTDGVLSRHGYEPRQWRLVSWGVCYLSGALLVQLKPDRYRPRTSWSVSRQFNSRLEECCPRQPSKQPVSFFITLNLTWNRHPLGA